jgi:TonB-linked SusC/RagA family outer membrane protein
MKRALLFFTMLMVIVASAYAQQRQVTGKVTGADGSPLPFATIQIKGTSTGTTSDKDGNYKVSVNPGAVLIVRSVGFLTENVTVGNSATLDVTLKADDKNLQEVVVTALGIQRKKNELPYSAQVVTAEEVTRTRDNNITNTLSGKVAGLEIRRNNSLGGSTNIVLRGVKSLTGNNQALFVVDGVPIDNSNTNTNDQQTARGGYDYGNAAADINPDDVESVNVLKGAASTALYGSRASNGVVMITTKKANRGMNVTLNSGLTYGSVDKSTFAKYQREYGAGYGQYYESPDKNFLYRDINGDGVKDLVVPMSEDASYSAKFDPSKQVYYWASFDPSSPNYMKTEPWQAANHPQSDIFVNPLGTTNSVFVDGGSDKGFVKLGYTKNVEEGIMPNSSVRKDIVNLAASYNITDRLTATGSANFSSVDGKGRYGTGYDSKNLMTNMRQWWQTNVDITEQKDAYFRTRKNVTWNWADPTDLVPAYWDNPYWTRYENYETDNRNRTFGYAALTYKATNWLDFVGRASIDEYNELQEERIAVGSIDVSEYQRYQRRFQENNYDLLANFHTPLSPSFKLSGVLGGNLRKTSMNDIRSKTNGGLGVPRIYSLSNTVSPMEAPVEHPYNEEVGGVFLSTTWSMKDFLFLDLSVRRDEASTLPENNNSYYYPASSLGFVFSKFLNNWHWLSNGKVRVNYAEVGNEAPPLITTGLYEFETSFNGEPLTYAQLIKGNPNLKPERTKSFETGLEAAFLDNRLGFDFTYYKMNSVNQIVPLPVSRSVGYNAIYINAGNIQNKGVELSVYATPVRTANFSWNINLNWSRNRNLVKALYPGIDNLQLNTVAFQGGVTLNATVGQPYGTIRGSNFVYNAKGQKEIDSQTGNYLISATSNEVIGNVNPDWIGGITNTLKYKGLSLTFLIDVRQGGQLFSLDQYYGFGTGLYPETAGLNELGHDKRDPVANGGGVLLKGVNEDGKTPNTTRAEAVQGFFGDGGNPNAGFVFNTSYVKLREVSLTYSLPAHTIARIHPFKGVDFSLTGRNLWIIHKDLKYADPEENATSGSLQGYQSGAYPTTRVLGFNVRLRF